MDYKMFGEREEWMAKARKLGVAFVDLDRIRISADAIGQLSSGAARRHHIIPVKLQGDALYLALSDIDDREAIRIASEVSGKRIIPVLAIPDSIEEALHRYYPIAKTEGS
jgi:type IV pilus assembly protein PilB